MADSTRPTEALTSLTLPERARANDPEAWQRLVHVYGPLVYHWAGRSGLSSHDAADLIQDVFRSVATALDRFQRERPGDSFRGWLWGVTRNRLRDFFRRRSTQIDAAGGTAAHAVLQEVPDDEPGGEDPDGAAGPGAVMRRALDLIRGHYEDRSWNAFWRVAVDGHAPADVAADLGMTVVAVYQVKYRILRRLRQEMGDVLD